MEARMAIDPTSERLACEIAEARRALVERLRETPDDWFRASDLKAEVRNGWSAGTTGLALGDLIADGTFEVQGDPVRLSG
jgi:hypothetical protein